VGRAVAVGSVSAGPDVVEVDVVGNARRFDVVGIGNAIVDVIAHVDHDFLEAEGLVPGSMTLVEEAEAGRLYAAMPPAVETSGGSAANTIAGVASLGGRVAYVGKVRDDQLGDVFRHDIQAVGVQYTTTPATSGPSTARCLVLVTPDAERTMRTFLGVSTSLGVAEIDPDALASTAIVYAEGYLWDAEDAKTAIRTAMETARRAGARVAFTLSDTFCVERHRSEWLGLLDEHVDVVFANEGELCSLFEVDDVEEALRRVIVHTDLACVTRSAAGSTLLHADGRRVDVPAWSTGTVLDTTGAGDLYAAGVLRGLTSGVDLRTAGWLGSVAAGECVSHTGPRPQTRLADLVARVPVPLDRPPVV